MYTKAPPMMAPVYNWSGPYIGVVGGYAWGHSTQADTGIVAPPPPPPPPPPPVAGGGPVADGSYSVAGGFIGGTLGLNYQVGALVLGLEGDYAWSDISGSSTLCGLSAGLPHVCGTRLDSFGTLRGRLGYAGGTSGNWLFFITGGLGLGDVHAWDNLTPASGSQFRAGWTAGGGIEVAFSPNWTAKIEYLHLDLGRFTAFDVIPGVPETVSLRTDMIRFGINYRFGG
jgi:outer membrane immunogenic protein